MLFRSGGYLVQSRDNGHIDKSDLKVVTKRQPSDREIADMLFAFTVCKHVKSNAIVYVKNGATVGIGAGQMSRVDSAKIAHSKSKDAAEAAGLKGALTEGSVAASHDRNRARAVLAGLVILLVFGAIGAVLWIGGHDMIEGRLSAGQLSAFVFYAVVVAGSVGSISEFFGDLQRAPNAYVSLLAALAEQLEPTQIIIIRGPSTALNEWQRQLARRYLPNAIVLSIPNGMGRLPALLAKPEGPDVNAWVCQGVMCLEPVSSLAALEALVFKGGQNG